MSSFDLSRRVVGNQMVAKIEISHQRGNSFKREVSILDDLGLNSALKGNVRKRAAFGLQERL